MSVKFFSGSVDNFTDLFIEAIDVAPVALLLLDESGKVVYANRECVSLFRYTLDELKRMSLPDFIPHSYRKTHKKYFAGYWQNPESRKMGVGREVYALRKDGTVFPAEVGLNPIEVPGEKLNVIAIIDNTFRKEVEQKIKELEVMKSRFFANISHEFKTPLMLIMGPVEDLLNKFSDPDATQKLELIGKYANRLLQLINQLLDLSKLESGKYKLSLVMEDLTKYIGSLVKTFSFPARDKGIELKFNSSAHELRAYFDFDIVEKVVSNLLTNAIKFTLPGGSITLTVRAVTSPLGDKKEENRKTAERRTNIVQIIVEDTGIGISEENLNKIFEPYYQVDSKNLGSGIGLSLVKELVSLHLGKIEATSIVGKGTSFCITLPLDKSVYKKIDFAAEKPGNISQFIGKSTVEKYLDKEIIAKGAKPENQDSNIRLNDKIILIIEDNQDLLHFMKSIIGRHYKVITAETLEVGLEKAYYSIPDLIISDVMLPGMDGLEGCRIMKNDNRTCHIPIILLTAKTELASKIKGLEQGADDYIQKPFNFEELLARVKNLITIKEKRCDALKERPVIKPVEVATNSLDEKFIGTVIDIIERNIKNPKFSISELAQGVFLSQSQLYRKIMGLTGYSPHEFIMSIRLQHSLDLLKKKAGSISEISFMVGFDSPAYFTKCFKDKYHTTPSQYFK